jgi:hypothetical protein
MTNDNERRVKSKTIRLRDKEHCKFVTTQPCLIGGRPQPKRITFVLPNPARSAAR